LLQRQLAQQQPSLLVVDDAYRKVSHAILLNSKLKAAVSQGMHYFVFLDPSQQLGTASSCGYKDA